MVWGMTIFLTSLRVNSQMVYISSITQEESSKILGWHCWTAAFAIFGNQIRSYILMGKYRERWN